MPFVYNQRGKCQREIFIDAEFSIIIIIVMIIIIIINFNNNDNNSNDENDNNVYYNESSYKREI